MTQPEGPSTQGEQEWDWGISTGSMVTLACVTRLEIFRSAVNRLEMPRSGVRTASKPGPAV